MKNLTIFFLLALCVTRATFAEETITSIDRDALFLKYKAPSYKVSMQKLSGLTFEQTQAYLISDIFDYVMDVQDDYIEKNKAPMKLFYPTHTREKIQNNILTLFTTPEDFTEENINSKVTNATTDYLKVVHSMNQDPVYRTINDLYFEVLSLKERIKRHEVAKEEENLFSPKNAAEKNSLEQLALTYGPMAISLIALIVALSGKRKKKA